MAPSHISGSSTTDGIPVAPSLGPTLQSVHSTPQPTLVSLRTVYISFVAILIAIAAAFIAQLLTRLIGLVTNVAFYGTLSSSFRSPAQNQLGLFVMGIPVIGALVVGVMARYGSKAIRGHGIPEAMEQVLFNQSKIPARLTFLKPLSAAIAIGTGGPFGAEGPIIATGGALGSVIGQLLKITAEERKTLLAAGAAAGMTATFGSPIAAVLLAIELLLFEFRPRSLIPVGLASVTATIIRYMLIGSTACFPMPSFMPPSANALVVYTLMGTAIGIVSVYVSRAVYYVEDLFERLPIHWMWWPAIGAIPVGLIGYFAPRTLGVGYDNIEQIVSGHLFGQALFILFVMKFFSWCISLGSGTSGGTLAPLFTIGGGLGSVLASALLAIFPHLGLDIRVAGLVGMAAMFTGASRAVLTSIVFAFETTQQPLGILPLLGGCLGAYFVSSLMARHSIMTEKIARRGARILSEYSIDYLDQSLVKHHCSRPVVSLRAIDTLENVRAWIASGSPTVTHQGFPVLDESQELMGVLTRRDLLETRTLSHQRVGDLIQKAAIVIDEEASLREAADLMIRMGVGRLVVINRSHPKIATGILTRSDLLLAHQKRLRDTEQTEMTFSLRQKSSSA